MENTCNGFADIFLAMNQRWLNEQEIHEGDWFEGEILYCGKCKKPRRQYKEFQGKPLLAKVMCECEAAESEKQRLAEEEEKRQQRVRELKACSGIDEKYRDARFETFIVESDNAKPKRIALRYCDIFADMRARNQGLLLWGGVGTGKTYMAACIGNRIMENLHTVTMTSFVKILQKKSSFNTEEDEEKFIHNLNRASLLIIDDLGAERSTDYALEKVYNIVDSRYRSGKPVIYTTNLSLREMKATTDIRYARIYDRIFETCHPVEFTGASWRKKAAAAHYDEIKSLLED